MHDLDDQLLALPKLRKIVLSRNIMGHQSINHLCKNCHLLQDVKVIECLPRHQPQHLLGIESLHIPAAAPAYIQAIGIPR